MYVIEDNIDFYNEIAKPDLIDEDSATVFCLISNTPLLSDFVTLLCGHKFNYKPLFLDTVNHKTKFNILESHILNITEIRCPYCRSIQKQLLPPNDIYSKIHGVNYFNENIYFSQLRKKPDKWVNGTCAFYNHINTDNNEIIPQCIFINDHKNVVYVDFFNSFLCHAHKNYCIHNYLTAKHKKEIAAKKQLKETAKIAILELKAKATLLIPYCSIILQTGKNKGKQCSFKCVKETTLCSRHYKSSLVSSSLL